MDITVVDDPELDRFEALLPTGEVAGFAAYRRGRDHLVLTHTEVFDRYEGQGVGTSLAAGTFARVREQGLRVRVVCPFLVNYLKRHPEEQDLVVPTPDAGAPS